MARLRQPPPAPVRPGQRAVGEYALRLAEARWTRENVEALTDDELAIELRGLIDREGSSPLVTGALKALEAAGA